MQPLRTIEKAIWLAPIFFAVVALLVAVVTQNAPQSDVEQVEFECAEIKVLETRAEELSKAVRSLHFVSGHLDKE